MRERITKEQKKKIEIWLQNNFDKYNKQTDKVASQIFALSEAKIRCYRLGLGLRFKGIYDVPDYVREHPGKTFGEYVKEIGISPSTMSKANSLFKLGLKHKYEYCNFTKAQVATKTFREVKEIMGSTDSALSHMARRKGWRFSDSQSLGRRENYHKLKTSNISELAKILSDREWCNKEQCQHDCLNCCMRWLNIRTKKAKNEA